MSNNYEAMPEWNDGKKEIEKAHAVNIFDNLEADELALLAEMIKPELAELGAENESIRISLIGDLNKIAVNSDVGILQARQILNNLYNILLWSKKGERNIKGELVAKRILEIKSNLKETIYQHKRAAAEDRYEEDEE
jgi:hypothetical protein